jgi:CO dehydrogenase maturation factor
MVLHQTKTISVSGKGGAGKTTLTVLMLKYLIEEKVAQDTLLVDADADANLSDMLAMPVTKTVGDLCDLKSLELKGEVQQDLRFRHAVLEALLHGNNFDLLVMGRTKGEGCYCTVNSYLSKITESIVRLYDVVLIDFDAGLEHFSRRSDRIADILIVVTDPSKMGFETAKRIKGLTEELGLDFRKEFLVGSKFSSHTKPLFYEQCRILGLEPGGLLPNHDQVAELNALGGSLLRMDWDPVLFKAIKEIWENILAQFKPIGR